jgi:hypothetical protein
VRRASVAALAIAIAAAAGLAAQAPSDAFTFERPATATVSGPQRLPVDQALLTGANPFRVVQRGQVFVAVDGLSDLRLFDSAGRPVPYLLVHPAAAEPKWEAGTVLPVAATKKSSGFEVDFARPQPIDAVRVEGLPAPFLKRLAVEGSGDRSRWTSLAAEATLFDLPAERLRQLEVGFTAGEYRYIRVTWNDANTGRVPLPRGVAARLADRAPHVAAPPIELAFERQASEPGRSRYRVRLPAARLPIVALELQVDGGHVFRTAVVTESRFGGTEAAPMELGRATLSRVVRDGIDASDLSVPITPPIETEVQVAIDDGSNAPLQVKRVLGTLARLPAIYFEVPAGKVLARYGNRTLQAPTYDLEAVRESIDIARVAEARWGDPRRLIETEPAVSLDIGSGPGGPIDAAAFEYTRAVGNAVPGLATLPLDAAVLARSRGPGQRFADVRLVDENNRQMPYLVERRDEPLQIDLTLTSIQSKAGDLRPAPGQQLSVYKLTLPYADLPPATLVLETPARVFQRNVRLGVERQPDRQRRDPWFDDLATARWRHADRDTAARPLTLRIDRTDETELTLAIEEGDNAALPVTSARLLLPSYRLRFFHPGGTVRLVYGRGDLRMPQYDLALLAEHVMGAPAREVTASADATPAAEAGRSRVISPVTFWILLGGAVAVLVGLIARLVRS